MKKEKVFLATTAIEEFWDTKKPLVFLGDWCLRYSRKNFWQTLNGNVIDGIWKNKQNLITAYNYLKGLYERLLSSLSISMNEIHDEVHNLRYWRIIIGPWLFHYLSVLYDRYLYINKAILEYPQFETIILSDKSFIIPEDTIDFVQLVSEDSYNLQIFSKILIAKGYNNFDTKDFNIKLIEDLINKSKRSLISFNIKRIINFIFSNLNPGKNVLMISPYFSKDIVFKIILKSKGKVLPIFFENTHTRTVQIDIQKRILLEKLSFESQCEFEKLVLYFIPHDIPFCYVENYKVLKEEAMKEYSLKPKAILTWVSYYFHEKFKIWAATMSEKGVKLIGAQHGGNYGLDQYMWAVEHEIKITDKFYTWGWKYGEFEHKIKPLPSSILIGAKQRSCDTLKKRDILYAIIAWPRFLYRMQYPTNNHLERYYGSMMIFIKHLDARIREMLKLRPFFKDYGGDVLNRIRDAKINIPLDSLSVPFQTSLDRCRLFICDQISTTYAEALAKNIPTIMFYDPGMYIHRPEVKSFFSDLQKVGVMHYSPESAANKVNEVYDIVDEWWNDEETQRVRSNFCAFYARTSPDAINEWVNELVMLSQET